jgi:hypothetical protein
MSISNRTAALIALAALLAIAGAFVAGTVVGDDSGEVDSLKDELGRVQSELDEEAGQRDEAEAEADSLGEENENLANQLAAEQDLSGELPSTAATGEAPAADYVLGAAGIVGDFAIEPSLDMTSSSDGVSRWVATITVKNNGSSPAELFCGDSGAELIDSLGRSYDGKSVIFREGSANCGDAVQPGLTIDDYKMEFSLPADAEPAVLELSVGQFGEGPTKSWAVSE